MTKISLVLKERSSVNRKRWKEGALIKIIGFTAETNLQLLDRNIP